MERKAAQQNKNTSEERKQGLSTYAQVKVNKEGGSVKKIYTYSKIAGNHLLIYLKNITVRRIHVAEMKNKG